MLSTCRTVRLVHQHYMATQQLCRPTMKPFCRLLGLTSCRCRTVLRDAIDNLGLIMETSSCFQALHWALHLLYDRLKNRPSALMQNQPTPSLRLLPPLMLVPSELASLKPQAEVLGGVLRASSMCLAIARLPAADVLHSSSATSMSPRAAITQAVFKTCLELVPLQQQLAGPCCSSDPGPATEQHGTAGEATVAGRASSWEEILFQQLGDSLTACATQQGK